MWKAYIIPSLSVLRMVFARSARLITLLQAAACSSAPGITVTTDLPVIHPPMNAPTIQPSPPPHPSMMPTNLEKNSHTEKPTQKLPRKSCVSMSVDQCSIYNNRLPNGRGKHLSLSVTAVDIRALALTCAVILPLAVRLVQY